MARKTYSDKKKQTILKAIEDYDKEHGRGGMANAHKQYKVSYLTLRRWLGTTEKTIKIPKTGKGKKLVRSAPGLSKSIEKGLRRIADLENQISKLQKQLANEKSGIKRLLD